ncbi:uncharacterized protein RJT21DRAFT_115667 [Scheffersomyces amazonensis]|uniref:uncharacterized protein n=1 Tax=Scheffersomyces amazonensis TaxID=1078765 RepID=UPI00315D041F
MTNLNNNYGHNVGNGSPYSRSESRINVAPVFRTSSGTGIGSSVILEAKPIINNNTNTNNINNTNTTSNSHIPGLTIQTPATNASDSLLTTAILSNIQHQHLESPFEMHTPKTNSNGTSSPHGSTSLTNLPNMSNSPTNSYNNNKFMRKMNDRRNSLGSPFNNEITSSSSGSSNNRNLYNFQSARNPNVISSMTPRKYGNVSSTNLSSNSTNNTNSTTNNNNNNNSNSNGNGNSINTGPSTSNNNININNSTSSIGLSMLNSSSTDKKRLVDQFYNANANESSNPSSRVASSLDIKNLVNLTGNNNIILEKEMDINDNGMHGSENNNLIKENNNIKEEIIDGDTSFAVSPTPVIHPSGNGSGNYSNLSSLNASPSLEVSGRKDDLDSNVFKLDKSRTTNNGIPINGINDEIFGEIIRNGGFKYDARVGNMINEDHMLGYLKLHELILRDEDEDEVKDDKENNLPKQMGFQRFNKQLKSMTQELIQQSQEISENAEIQSNLNDLKSLDEYLDKLNIQTKELMNQLITNKEDLKSNYQRDINDSINRLNDISLQLTSLETRLTILKDKINQDKLVMSREMIDKLQVLEFVDERFKDYMVVSSIRRFKRVNITISVIVVLFGIYMYYYR